MISVPDPTNYPTPFDRVPPPARLTAPLPRQYILLEYVPVCNNARVLVPGQPFEPTGMSEVLWVFYMSKARRDTAAKAVESPLLSRWQRVGGWRVAVVVNTALAGGRCWISSIRSSSWCGRRIGSSVDCPAIPPTSSFCCAVLSMIGG